MISEFTRKGLIKCSYQSLEKAFGSPYEDGNYLAEWLFELEDDATIVIFCHKVGSLEKEKVCLWCIGGEALSSIESVDWVTNKLKAAGQEFEVMTEL